jgi:hypothetical protein
VRGAGGDPMQEPEMRLDERREGLAVAAPGTVHEARFLALAHGVDERGHAFGDTRHQHRA